jgi:hypothetical protein
MNRLFHILIFSCVMLGAYASVPAQYYSPDPHAGEERRFFGQPYKVREIKVYLTYEETGGPYANREVQIKYYWKWDVIKSTPETDRMSNIRYLTVMRTTDESGVVIVPAMTIIPTRPSLPGAEVSEPKFQSVGITVIDEKHSVGLAIFSPPHDLTDENGEVHRIVMLYPRPPTKPQ